MSRTIEKTISTCQRTQANTLSPTNHNIVSPRVAQAWITEDFFKFFPFFHAKSSRQFAFRLRSIIQSFSSALEKDRARPIVFPKIGCQTADERANGRSILFFESAGDAGARARDGLFRRNKKDFNCHLWVKIEPKSFENCCFLLKEGAPVQDGELRKLFYAAKSVKTQKSDRKCNE